MDTTDTKPKTRGGHAPLTLRWARAADAEWIHNSYTLVKIINLTSNPRCRFNPCDMAVATSIRPVVVPMEIVEIVALSARRIPFIRLEPRSG
jgi:hypothetical protein